MDYEFYDGTHTGQEIDDGIDKALGAVSAPASGSTDLITAGGVYNGLYTEAMNRNQAIQQAISATNPNKVAMTLNASGWSNGVYSFNSSYPFGQYDLTVEVSDTATTAQYEAFAAGEIVGSATNNTIKALGVVPTMNIPIILTVRALRA